MKKKIVSVLLCSALVMSMAAGCGSKSAESTEKEDKAEETTEETAEDSDVQADPVDQRRVYVTPDWVKSVMDGNQEGYEDYVIAEVDYMGDEEAKDSSYAQGHIPGAILVGDVEVEDAEGTVEAPYNLLAADTVVENMLSHGITKDTKVILYGGDPAGVGRVAYAYLWAGVEDVKILNGGVEAWKTAGYTADETDVNEGEKAEDFGVEAPAHPEFWVSMDDAKDRVANDENFKLVSIRAEDEFLGKTSGYSYIDRAGEPEGAVWGKGAETAFDVNGFLNEDGTVMELADIQEKVWKDVDFTVDNDLAFYCGTGWRATVPFLVMYQEGHDNVACYDGGWYEWQMHDENPVQVGDPASDDCQHVTVKDLPTDKAAK